jgi:hypothetical protein
MTVVSFSRRTDTVGSIAIERNTQCGQCCVRATGVKNAISALLKSCTYVVSLLGILLTYIHTYIHAFHGYITVS